MELETLIKELGIIEHMQPLTEWRDQFLREQAENLQTKDGELKSRDETISEFEKTKADFVARVNSALMQGDLSGFVEIAKDLVTPAQEKQKQEDLARAESLKAEAYEIESKYE